MRALLGRIGPGCVTAGYFCAMAQQQPDPSNQPPEASDAAKPEAEEVPSAAAGASPEAERNAEPDATHRAGFVNVIGRPNAGKSTLGNAIMGEQLSAITPKAQTTRHRILGMLNGPDYQLVFSDTPGLIYDPAYALHERMNDAVKSAFQDADVLLFLTGPEDRWDDEDPILKRLDRLPVPLFVLINKADRYAQEEVVACMQRWEARFARTRKDLPAGEGTVDAGQPVLTEVLPISALHGHGVAALRERLIALLPQHPPYYPKDQWTDRPERFFVTETVRAKILEHYQQEIPYSVEVVVESFKEEPTIIRIQTLIFANRSSQKSILIGKGGSALTRMGKAARQELEAFFGKKVFLGIHVKVREGWRENDRDLKSFGYEG